MSRTAVIFAGAVAKGAFGAGAIDALTAAGVELDRVVGASAGALNAAYFAAATRRGCARTGAERLVQLWLDDGRWTRFLHLDGRAILDARGVSDSKQLLELLRTQIAELPAGKPRDVELRIIIAPLDGVNVATASGVATTFEDVQRFEAADFDSAERLERIVVATAASAAFPGLFAAVDVPGRGPCIDGGAVSNAPVKEAIGDDGAIDRIFVVVPYPKAETQPGRTFAGTQLVSRLVDILIQERLFRDLTEAAARNASLGALDELVRAGALSAEQLQRVLEAIGWHRSRPIDVIEVRPPHALDGTAFAGFFDRALREQYIEAGRQAARAALPSK